MRALRLWKKAAVAVVLIIGTIAVGAGVASAEGSSWYAEPVVNR